jgi:hypothetical protein
MTSRLALLALLPILAFTGVARADEHYAREVVARFGVPQGRDVVTCGGEQGGQAIRCIRWQYDSGKDHAVFFFDEGSERLVEVFTWDDEHRDANVASEQVRTILHAARTVAEP